MRPADHERELVEMAVEGDRSALQKLFVTQAALLSRYAATKLPAWLRDRVDPEDIAQQTLIEAFRSIGRFRSEKAESFQAWLLGIADYVIKDTVKRHHRAKRGGRFQRVQRG